VDEGAPDTLRTDGRTAIDVRGLVKRYGGRAVVDGLTFSVGAGEVFALLGPNGAGKTTTVEILEGYRDRDGGTVSVLGLDPRREAHRLRPKIGLMLQEGGVYPQARPREMLELFASFYPDPEPPAQLLDLVGLGDSLKTPYRRLSGGQKQRLSLALALIGRPELIFLDEPTAGMDPAARRATWEVIQSLRARGVTVLLTTHAMEEAERLADRIAIVDRGRLAALGDLASLRRADEEHGAAVRLTIAGDRDIAAALAALPSARQVRTDGPGAYLVETRDAPALLAEATAWAHLAGVAIRELRVGPESLEEIFLRLTGRLGDA
jgi:ABC-2 type transport system ATP-binding protein